MIREVWIELVPKVIGIAEEESDNGTIEELISTAPEVISDGKLLVRSLGILLYTDDLFAYAKSIHALILLYHLMPDVKTSVNHQRIVCMVPVSDFLCNDMFVRVYMSIYVCSFVQVCIWVCLCKGLYVYAC